MSENGSRTTPPAGILPAHEEHPAVARLRRPEAVVTEQPPAPDAEVVGHATMRRYSQGFKRRILREVEAAPLGEVGAILRREGLYYSTLRHFRQQQEEGLLDLKSNKRSNAKPSPSTQQQQLASLLQENRALKHQLKQAQLVLELQKKACELLNLPFQSLDEAAS